MLMKRDLNEYDLEAVLAWYVENGIDGAWAEEPQNRLKPAPRAVVDVTEIDNLPEHISSQTQSPSTASKPKPATAVPSSAVSAGSLASVPAGVPLKEAQELAKQANSLSDLKAAIQDFPHLSIKSTASQIVFGDGIENAELMIIGDAPQSDDDRTGIAFAGEVGDLLNKMMAAIGRTRTGDTPQNSIYVTHILKWRPPGNRSPAPFELDVSMPFIKRQIELIAPRAVLVMGAVAARTVLGSTETITKLRGKFHDIELPNGTKVTVMASFDPSYLLKSPTQKKAAWDDLQKLRDFLA